MTQEPHVGWDLERNGVAHAGEPDTRLAESPRDDRAPARGRRARESTGVAPGVGHRRRPMTRPSPLPQLITVDDAADFLRTSRCAIYAMLERGQLPPPVRIGRRVLLVQDELLDWLHQKRAPSLQE